jgi:preprotein translocase subunit YajC
MFNFLTDAAATGGNAGGAGGFGMIIMLVVMVAVFYFLMIRPENKRKKEAEQMRSAVKVGDEIVTIGGICGTVVHVKDDKFVIETGADQVRVEFAKWALSANESAAARAKEEAQKAAEARAKAKAEKKAAKAKKS